MTETTDHEWMRERLASIPDRVLTGRDRHKLARWLENRGWRPTFDQIESERRRRDNR